MSERIVTKTIPDVAAALNPHFHDEFVAFCALYYSGDITEEEWALLQIHMGYCDTCQKSFEEFGQITSHVIPAMAAAAASDLQTEQSPENLESAERRLMDRLDSLIAEEQKPRSRRTEWRLLGTLIAACLLGLASLLGYEVARIKNSPESKMVQPPPSAGQAQSTVTTDVGIRQVLSQSQDEIAELKKQVAERDERLRQVNSSTASIEKQLATEEGIRKQISDERDQLSQQLAAKQAEIDSMRNRRASVEADDGQSKSNYAALEGQVRELRTALDEKDAALSAKDRMLDLDKDFLAHDRDIRDLIGARNLYIADIFDTTENGRTAKQFGRIFYTQDRSLIFYGFDLDSQAGHRRDVSFQVWGSGSARPNPVSLGLFYQDDSHKRWVLKCNDAKSLARLDMVFVTVEPPGGSSKPTGKQLLRAYLQIHPNHP